MRGQICKYFQRDLDRGLICVKGGGLRAKAARRGSVDRYATGLTCREPSDLDPTVAVVDDSRRRREKRRPAAASGGARRRAAAGRRSRPKQRSGAPFDARTSPEERGGRGELILDVLADGDSPEAANDGGETTAVLGARAARVAGAGGGDREEAAAFIGARR